MPHWRITSDCTLYKPREREREIKASSWEIYNRVSECVQECLYSDRRRHRRRRRCHRRSCTESFVSLLAREAAKRDNKKTRTRERVSVCSLALTGLCRERSFAGFELFIEKPSSAAFGVAFVYIPLCLVISHIGPAREATRRVGDFVWVILCSWEAARTGKEESAIFIRDFSFSKRINIRPP